MDVLPALGHLPLADRADDFDAQGYAIHIARVMPIPATATVPRNISMALCFAARACCRVHAFMMSPGSFEKQALDVAAEGALVRSE
jgi:hypothetical protein